MMYGAPPPIRPLRRLDGTEAFPEVAAALSNEQIVSLLMQRLQPALDELHARLDKIENRLPLADDERVQLEAIRAAVRGIGAKP